MHGEQQHKQHQQDVILLALSIGSGSADQGILIGSGSGILISNNRIRIAKSLIYLLHVIPFYSAHSQFLQFQLQLFRERINLHRGPFPYSPVGCGSGSMPLFWIHIHFAGFELLFI